MSKQDALRLAMEIIKIPPYANRDIFDLADDIMKWYLS